MSLNDKDLTRLLAVAVQAVKAAGEVISSYQGSSVATHYKSSGTSLASKVVTQVDNEAEQSLLAVLGPTVPEYDLGLLSEESSDDQSRFSKDYFWCVDPLDGTLAFTQDKAGYCSSIALVSRTGESKLGVVYDPRKNNLYHAIKGHGAFKNGQSFKVAANQKEVTWIASDAGAVMQALWTIETSPSLFVKKPKPEQGGGCLWDYAASSVIHSEAGGYHSDYYFSPLHLNAADTVFMNQVGVIFSSGLTIEQIQALI